MLRTGTSLMPSCAPSSLKRRFMTKFDTEYWMTIDGRSESAAQTLPVFNPATRSEFARVPDATRPQLDQAVAAARRAFNSWSVSTLETRRRALNAIADIVEANVEDLIALLTREQGKPRDGAEWEVRGSSVWCREIAKQSLPDEIVEDTPDRRVITRFSPLGVVGGIVPWNFPILIAIWKIAPALMAGNTIIIKPSPFTPLCTLKLGQ